MKKPTPAPEVPAPVALPQSGGSWVRLADGTLQLEEATDSTPEAIAAAVEGAVQGPVETPADTPVKEA